jgi:uncharacterized protein (DUF934 family)
MEAAMSWTYQSYYLREEMHFEDAVRRIDNIMMDQKDFSVRKVEVDRVQ